MLEHLSASSVIDVVDDSVFSVSRNAFGECGWDKHSSRRKPEIDVVDFLIFDGKVEIDNVNFGLRRETFSYEQRIRSLCEQQKSARTKT